VFIKIFKDIPKMDLEMLLPGTRVRMSLKDRGKITLPILTGLAVTTWKFLTPLLQLFEGAALGAIFAGYSLLAFLGLAGGTVGYGVRSFYGYLQTKQK